MRTIAAAPLSDEAADANPLIPKRWKLTALVFGGTLIALDAVAIVSLFRDRHYTPAQRLLWLLWLLWLLVILAVPVLGAFLWLAVGRRAPARR
ncbi:PLDc N-terminal domain-containing protein [Kocuria rosea]|uniref:Cardiolipin synthase N-terminal domain-containing protein n=1 Tax=Kocuria rosea TaxID=1275 RepID=A0A4R5YCN2_KOCRO|nr:PLDc N-terminal domain-containing protein [Kocuria rosea]TDL42465.1 hypothetical protein E2R59_11000 [Kocuria rosea]